MGKCVFVSTPLNPSSSGVACALKGKEKKRERERPWLWCKQCTDKQHRSGERFFRIKNWDEEREEREKEID